MSFCPSWIPHVAERGIQTGTGCIHDTLGNAAVKRQEKCHHSVRQPEIKPENRTGTIEQLAQNVEAVEKKVQLMGVKISRNHMH